VGLTDLVTPETTTNGDDGQLGGDDGTTDGSGNFLCALNTETDVTVMVTNNDEGFELGTLTGSGLLLDGHNLHDLILQLTGKEEINDLVLLDGDGVEVDLLELLDLTLLDESAKLGNGNPALFLLGLSATTTATTTSVTISSSAASTTASTTSCLKNFKR
jgi:hypothetical protein